MPGDGETDEGCGFDVQCAVQGNPGVVGYYADFCEAVWREAGGEAEVTCLGLLGHSTRPGLYPPGAVWSLQNQVRHLFSPGLSRAPNTGRSLGACSSRGRTV